MPRIVELAVDHQIGHPLQRGGDELQRARRVGGGERGLGVGVAQEEQLRWLAAAAAAARQTHLVAPEEREVAGVPVDRAAALELQRRRDVRLGRHEAVAALARARSAIPRPTGISRSPRLGNCAANRAHCARAVATSTKKSETLRPVSSSSNSSGAFSAFTIANAELVGAEINSAYGSAAIVGGPAHRAWPTLGQIGGAIDHERASVAAKKAIFGPRTVRYQLSWSSTV